MKFRVGLLLLGCGVALHAQMQMNASQLAQFLRSELALKFHTDKQIAEYLKKVTLTERLTNKEVEDLEAQGAGPKVTQVLQELEQKSQSLKSPTASPTYSPATSPDSSTTGGPPSVQLSTKKAFPPPSSVRQAAILDEVKQYALNYTQNLPNFICTQVTRRYVDFNNSDSYHNIDTAFTHLSYNEGSEHYKTYMINGQMVDYDGMGALEKRGGAVSNGEFGSLMREIFDPKSQAEFNWDHWGNIRGKLMAVYNYFIDSGHSQYSISYEDSQRIITAYRGLIYADQNTGAISRITFVAVNIPSSFPVRSAEEILDFDDVQINGQPYICPLKADVRLTGGGQKTKNEIEFRNYRKYGTESTITYDTPEALPASETQEQPASAAKNANGEKQVKPGSTPQTQSNQQQSQQQEESSPWSLPQAPPPPPQ
jgi:hypothetical protein